MKFSNKQIIYAILLIAFLLRFPGIFDGLPAVYNSTEYYHAKYAMSMGARQSLDPQISNYDIYNPRLFIYPMFYQYLVLLEYALLFLAGSLFGIFKDSYDFALKFLISPSVFYVVGRLVNILASLFTVFIVYKKMSKIYSDQIGFISALIFSVSYYMIIASQQAVSDVWLILFCALVILYLIDFLRRPVANKIILASVFCGLAIGTKYNAGVLLILFLYVSWVERKWFFDKNIKYVFYAGLVGVVCFLIPNPYWIIRFSQFVEGIQLIGEQASESIALERGINYIWEFWQIVKYEWLIGLGFFVSTVYFAFKRDKFTLMLVIMIIITFLYVGSWQKKGIDYLYPIYPAWILLFSLFIQEIINKFKNKNVQKNLVLLIIFIPSLFMGSYQIILKIRPDTRELATDWIKENVNQQDNICYDNYHYDLGLFDLNRYLGYGAGASQLPDKLKQKLKTFTDHPDNYKFVPIVYKNDDIFEKTDNLFKTEQLFFKRKSIDQLKSENTKYFVTNSWFYQPYFEVNKKDYSELTVQTANEIKNLYYKLNENYKPVKIFNPDFWTNGPEIKVYALN